MTKVDYNPEFTKILNDLTTINKSLVLTKEGDKVFCQRADADKTLGYRIEAPAEYFNFPEEQLAFYEYAEFYKYMSTFKEPQISKNGQKITLSEGSAKINYVLSNPEGIKPGPKNLNFAESEIKFVLDGKTIDEFAKMKTLIGAKHIKVSNDGDSVVINIFHPIHSNSFEKKFKACEGTIPEFEYVFFADIFEKLPTKKDYTVEVRNTGKGYLQLTLAHDNIFLGILVGSLKNKK